MRGVTYQGLQKVSCNHVTDPEILHAKDVIVKVNAAAICGSDLHVYRGHEEGPDIGTILGHEFAGEVVDIGRDIYNLKKGDHVVSPFTTNCGQCHYCKIGLTCRCKNGMLYGWSKDGNGLQGGQAEYIRVPLADTTLITYSKEIAAEMALLAGDVLSTGFYCAKQAEIKPGGTFAVIGCGPVGLMTVVAARELGAKTVFAIDSVPERLAIAQSFGALALHMDELDPVEVLIYATHGIGVDAALEAVGNQKAAKMAYDCIKHGGVISTVGVHHSRNFPFTPVQAYDKNITYKIGRAPARFFMERSIKLISEERYNLQAIITHHMKLEEASEAYCIFDQKSDGCIKPVLIP